MLQFSISRVSQPGPDDNAYVTITSKRADLIILDYNHRVRAQRTNPSFFEEGSRHLLIVHRRGTGTEHCVQHNSHSDRKLGGTRSRRGQKRSGRYVVTEQYCLSRMEAASLSGSPCEGSVADDSYRESLRQCCVSEKSIEPNN